MNPETIGVMTQLQRLAHERLKNELPIRHHFSRVCSAWKWNGRDLTPEELPYLHAQERAQ